MRALALFIATEFLSFRKSRLDSTPNRKGIRILKGKPKRVCRSTGRLTDPCHGRPRRSTFSNRELALFSQSTASMQRSTVDRAVDRSVFVHLVHTSRPGSRPAACCMRRFSLLCLPISVLPSFISSISSFPTILHLGEDFSNLSRTPTNIWRNRHDLGLSAPNEIDTRSRLGTFSSAIN